MYLCRYHCGSAREFHYADGSRSPSQSMSCLWDKTWSATTQLGECQWVACLKVITSHLILLMCISYQPPTPPVGTHLRVTHWDGEPIAFDDQVMFVCERGYYFEVRQPLLIFITPHSFPRLTITRPM